MGKALMRLNPKVESQCTRILYESSATIFWRIAQMLPERMHKKRGQKPHDYRIVIVLCLLRILFFYTYNAYEIVMRRDPRLCKIFDLKILPGKSTLQRMMHKLTMKELRKLNQQLIKEHIRKNVNLSLDASGIQLVGRSIWYCIRIKKKIRRKNCDKIHIAICNDTHIIANWFVTGWKTGDSPYLKKLLEPYKTLGIILADAAYLSRKNCQLVVEKLGSPFFGLKKGITKRSKGFPAWRWMLTIADIFSSAYRSIYSKRSTVESVFSALKRRYGDMLRSKRWHIRRKEMAMRFIAYNIRLIIYHNYARKKNLPIWVRA